MTIIRNFLFYLGVIPSILFISTIGLMLFFLPYRYRYWLITRWSYIYIYLAKWCCGLNFTVEGLENLPNESAVVLSNHQSSWETIFFQIILPPQTWVLKKELLFLPGFGWALALIEPIAINRSQMNSVKAVLKKGKEYLNKGRWIVVFPEGTRTKPGEMKPFARTGAALAHAASKPIVPIAHNAGKFWPKGFLIKKPGTIRVVIGRAIETASKSLNETNTLAENWVRNELEKI